MGPADSTRRASRSAGHSRIFEPGQRSTTGHPDDLPPALEPAGRRAWCGATLVVMTALISHTSFDSVDACASSVFWGKVLGFVEDPDDPNQPGDEECMIASTDGTQRLLFIEVPDGKHVKNRVHLDLKPAEGATGSLSLRGFWHWVPERSPTDVCLTGQAGSCSPILKATSSAFCVVTPSARRHIDCKHQPAASRRPRRPIPDRSSIHDRAVRRAVFNLRRRWTSAVDR